LNGFDQVQVLEPVYLAQDNIAHFQIFGPDWYNRAKLAGLDFAAHRIPARPKLNGFASFKPINASSGPTHIIAAE
jgi:hypothetical protein